METGWDRRRFIGAAAGAAALSGIRASASAAEEQSAGREGRTRGKKAVVLGMLPGKLPLDDRFKLARDVGFEGVEAYTTEKAADVEALKKAADKAGIAIHSVMNSNHWSRPLSSPDEKHVAEGIRGMETSLRNAKAWRADTVLLVPAVVSPNVRYVEAYERSIDGIRKLLPLAKELEVIIAVENVWNKFLLSPIEFRRYVDRFESPFLKAYFDVGNIVLYGYPQDWIRTLGKRIVKIHLKDFDSKSRRFVGLREGSIDWPEVRRALDEAGYSGWFTAELRGGDEAYLREVSKQMDLIIAGK